MSREEVKHPGSDRSRRLRSDTQNGVVQNQRPRRKLSHKEQLTRGWSLKLIVAHRLAVEKKTLRQLQVFVESTGSLGKYFETHCPSDEHWKEALQEISIPLPHGIYALKREAYQMLQPDIYPYDMEEDKIHVINEMERLRKQDCSQPESLNRPSKLKRRLLSPKEGEPEPKKPKSWNETVEVNHHLNDLFLTEHCYAKTESQSLPEHIPSAIAALNPPSNSQHPANPNELNVIHLVSDPEDEDLHVAHSKDNIQGVETYVGDLMRQNRSFVKKIKLLRKENGNLQRKIEADSKSQTTIISLQQRLSEAKTAKKRIFQGWLDERNDKNDFIKDKDELIQQLHASNSQKDLLIENLRQDLDNERTRTNLVTQTLDTANQDLQIQQQEISQKDNSITNLHSRNDHIFSMFAREKQLRNEADRRADEAVRIAQNTQQSLMEVSHRLVSAENSLRAVRDAAQNYLADDERRLQARRSAMQQWSVGGIRR